MIFDKILHLSPATISSLINERRFMGFQAGDNETGIFTLFCNFSLEDNPYFPVPGTCLILKVFEKAHLAAFFRVNFTGLLESCLSHCRQDRVFAQTQYVLNIIPFAPGKYLGRGKMRITPQKNAYFGPGASDPFDDSLDD